MPVLSDSILRCVAPSGNHIVVSVSPQYLNLPHFTEVSLNRVCLDYGKQLAHEKDGVWYRPAGWEVIEDPKTIAMLERVPLV